MTTRLIGTCSDPATVTSRNSSCASRARDVRTRKRTGRFSRALPVSASRTGCRTKYGNAVQRPLHGPEPAGGAAVSPPGAGSPPESASFEMLSARRRLRAAVERDPDVALPRGGVVLAHRYGPEEADDVAGLLLEFAAEIGVEPLRQKEGSVRPGHDGDGVDRGALLDEVRAPLFHPGAGREGRGRGRRAAGREVARLAEEIGMPLRERRLDAARPELARDDEEAGVHEERREDDRGHQEQVRDDEPAPDAPEETAQERARRAHEEDGAREDEEDDAEARARRRVRRERDEEDARGREKAADLERARELHRGARGGTGEAPGSRAFASDAR